MNEKILNTRKNGLPMLVLWGILNLASISLLIFGGMLLDEGRQSRAAGSA